MYTFDFANWSHAIDMHRVILHFFFTSVNDTYSSIVMRPDFPFLQGRPFRLKRRTTFHRDSLIDRCSILYLSDKMELNGKVL